MSAFTFDEALRSSSRSEFYWMLDHESSVCIKCGEAFTMTLRRHHCRRCGVLICYYCMRKAPQTGERVCKDCCGYLEFKMTNSLAITPAITTTKNPREGKRGGVEGPPALQLLSVGVGEMVKTACVACTEITRGSSGQSDDSSRTDSTLSSPTSSCSSRGSPRALPTIEEEEEEGGGAGYAHRDDYRPTGSGGSLWLPMLLAETKRLKHPEKVENVEMDETDQESEDDDLSHSTATKAEVEEELELELDIDVTFPKCVPVKDTSPKCQVKSSSPTATKPQTDICMREEEREESYYSARAISLSLFLLLVIVYLEGLPLARGREIMASAITITSQMLQSLRLAAKAGLSRAEALLDQLVVEVIEDLLIKQVIPTPTLLATSY